MRTEKTECRMPNCQRPHIRGECDKNCYYNTRQVMTNADRIRAMTEKELAEWLDDISKACYYEGYTKETDEPQMSPYPTSPRKWVAWLKQEAET